MQRSHSTHEKKTSTKRVSKERRENALQLLTKDHRLVAKMFKDFDKAKENNDQAMKRELINTVCEELRIHMLVEEQLLYPQAAEALEDEDLIAEARVEHDSAKQLIQELASMKESDELYDAKFIVLGEYINHHVEEEEKEMFPKLKKSGLDLLAIGDQIKAMKEEIKAGGVDAAESKMH